MDLQLCITSCQCVNICVLMTHWFNSKKCRTNNTVIPGYTTFWHTSCPFFGWKIKLQWKILNWNEYLLFCLFVVWFKKKLSYLLNLIWSKVGKQFEQKKINCIFSWINNCINCIMWPLQNVYYNQISKFRSAMFHSKKIPG